LSLLKGSPIFSKVKHLKIVKTVHELAKFLGEEFAGDGSRKITGINSLGEARRGDITFATKDIFIERLKNSGASAAIIPFSCDATGLKTPFIRSKNPYFSFAKVLSLFHPAKVKENGTHPSAVLGKNVKIGKKTKISAHVVIGDNVTIGSNVILHPCAVIEDNVKIGDNTTIYSNVSIREETEIGRRCIIHSGAVLGSDGFGFVLVRGSHRKIPQVGKVVIEDDVELGANVSIDRATVGVTRIGKGTKIDNLVHIAHNVVVGKNSLIIAQVGISGSAEVGDNVTLAGQVGVVGHLKIGCGTTVAARSVVMSNLPPNSFVSGFPAKPHKEEMKIKACLKRLPELVKTVNGLKKRVFDLSNKAAGEEPELG
jgi:UDP-3-O-[3-hydroxymyristoyl] glucosamine N-acyltransferase